MDHKIFILKQYNEHIVRYPIVPYVKTRRVGLEVSVSTSHAVGHGFTPWPGHTKDDHKNDTNCLPAWHTCIRVGV